MILAQLGMQSWLCTSLTLQARRGVCVAVALLAGQPVFYHTHTHHHDALLQSAAAADQH